MHGRDSQKRNHGNEKRGKFEPSIRHLRNAKRTTRGPRGEKLTTQGPKARLGSKKKWGGSTADMREILPPIEMPSACVCVEACNPSFCLYGACRSGSWGAREGKGESHGPVIADYKQGSGEVPWGPAREVSRKRGHFHWLRVSWI